MSRAMAHLADARTSVGETSRLLGYASEDGFSRAFRRHTGLTPSAWRESRLMSA